MSYEAAMLVAGAFFGAVVSGSSGFAFGVVSSALWLHVLPPLRAVPLIVASSMLLNLAFTLHMRRDISARRIFPMLIGSIAGVPLGVAVLQSANAGALRMGIGMLLVVYSLFLLFARNLPAPALPRRQSVMADGSVGFLSGLLGGATSLNGILMAMWVQLRGWSKIEQRAMTQPFVLFTHVLTLAWLGGVGGLDMRTGQDILYCLPALAAGGWLGLRVFHRLSDSGFNRIVLWLLLGSGVSLLLRSLER
jgi:uncharacterized membrane protein YfcA